MSRLRVTWAFVAVLFRSLSRDRTALLFMIALPVLVIVVIGAAFGGGDQVRIGVVASELGPGGTALVTELDGADGVAVTRYDDTDAADRAIRRGEVSAALVVPTDFEDELAGSGQVDVPFLGRPGDQAAVTARVATSGALDRLAAAVGASRVVVADLGGTFGATLTSALDPATGPPAAEVEVVDVGSGGSRDLSRFSLVAPQNLVLFVFITSLSAGAYLVTIRKAGVLRRVASMQPTAATVITGLSAGWFAIALVQSAIILTIGAVAFDVDWGDAVGATSLAMTFAAVGASAGLLIGTLGRDEDKVGSLAPIVGIALGALGGCMVPVEVFPPAMLAIAHAIPHYWAVAAWQSLIFDGAGVGDIAGSLAVLVGFVVVLLGTTTVLLRRQLSSG